MPDRAEFSVEQRRRLADLEERYRGAVANSVMEAQVAGELRAMGLRLVGVDRSMGEWGVRLRFDVAPL